MTDTSLNVEHQYEAVRETGGWLAIKDAGMLIVSGSDRLAFVQRQTTNDLRTLSENQVITTVLTTPTARILDVLRVYQQGDNLVLLTLPGRAPKTFSFLKSRIFFNDQVTIQDVSSQFVQIELLGPVFPGLLAALDSGFDPERGMQPFQFQDTSGHYLPRDPDFTLGDVLVLPVDRLASWELWAGQQRLEQAAAVREILRVEAGLPGPEMELTEQHTPLEVGLASAISSRKGCYTGQEVIARQITYDKIVKQLYPLKLQSEAPPGSPLEAAGFPVGTITSCVFSPRHGWLALAVIKTKTLDAETTLRLEASPGETVKLLDEPVDSL